MDIKKTRDIFTILENFIKSLIPAEKKPVKNLIITGERDNMNIIYEDSKIIIVEKEAGKLTQSGKSFDLDLTGEVLAYRRKKGEDVYAALINRLDRPVSGLVLFAKNKPEAARLSKQMQQGGFCKQYYAIVCGKLPERSGTFVDYLVKDAVSNTSRTAGKGEAGAKRAELKYEVVEEYGGILSLVRVELITGRHHQIRVQFASRGLPVLGDGKYGGAAAEWLLSAPQLQGEAPERKMQKANAQGEAPERKMQKANAQGEAPVQQTAEVQRQDTASTPEIHLKRGEIALCAYSLTVDKKTYTIEPRWKCI